MSTDVNKEWFINKTNGFLEDDEINKMSKLDGSLIFEPDVCDNILSIHF